MNDGPLIGVDVGTSRAKVLACALPFVETLEAGCDADAARRRNEEALRMAKNLSQKLSSHAIL